jgi:hypothetical protein
MERASHFSMSIRIENFVKRRLLLIFCKSSGGVKRFDSIFFLLSFRFEKVFLALCYFWNLIQLWALAVDLL